MRLARYGIILALTALSGCVAVPYSPGAYDAYDEPYPGYYGGYAYDYYPYSYYYGYYGAYPSRYDFHRHYNWGYWHGNNYWHNEGGRWHGSGERGDGRDRH